MLLWLWGWLLGSPFKDKPAGKLEEGSQAAPGSSTLGIRAGAPREGGEKLNPEREGSQGSGKSREPLSPLGLKGQRREREALLEARISGRLVDAGSFQACLLGAGIPEG